MSQISSNKDFLLLNYGVSFQEYKSVSWAQLTFTSSKSTIETLEKDVKYV